MINIADPQVSRDARSAVDEILQSGLLADGPEVRAFEEEFAIYSDVNHAVATSNGTTALHAALEGLGIGRGDRVITTPYSFIASANAIRLAGAEPVFADIDRDTYNLDPDHVEALLVDNPDGYAAILPVHLYGLPADMDRFVELAETYDLSLIEDCAQAHGARYDGQPVGSFGNVGCFSFYPTKNMTTGEGGMITTNSSQLADRVASYVNHGRVSGDRSYDHETIGHNFRMTSIAAAIGREQLKRLPEFVEQRRANAGLLSDLLVDADVEVPIEPADRWHAYHQYTIRTDDRDSLREALFAHDIASGVYYPRPIPQDPAYAGVEVEVPIAEAAAESVLSLPIHPKLNGQDIHQIAEVIIDHAS